MTSNIDFSAAPYLTAAPAGAEVGVACRTKNGEWFFLNHQITAEAGNTAPAGGPAGYFTGVFGSQYAPPMVLGQSKPYSFGSETGSDGGGRLNTKLNVANKYLPVNLTATGFGVLSFYITEKDMGIGPSAKFTGGEEFIMLFIHDVGLAGGTMGSGQFVSVMVDGAEHVSLPSGFGVENLSQAGLEFTASGVYLHLGAHTHSGSGAATNTKTKISNHVFTDIYIAAGATDMTAMFGSSGPGGEITLPDGVETAYNIDFGPDVVINPSVQDTLEANITPFIFSPDSAYDCTLDLLGLQNVTSGNGLVLEDFGPEKKLHLISETVPIIFGIDMLNGTLKDIDGNALEVGSSLNYRILGFTKNGRGEARFWFQIPHTDKFELSISGAAIGAFETPAPALISHTISKVVNGGYNQYTIKFSTSDHAGELADMPVIVNLNVYTKFSLT